MTPDPAWYGSDPIWTAEFDGHAYRDFGKRLTVSQAAVLGCLQDPSGNRPCGKDPHPSPANELASATHPRRVYRVADVDIQARVEPVDVTVVFERYRYFGGGYLAEGKDFPLVFADTYVGSPHRYPDGSLCLYYPLDPIQRRWTADLGLRSLISLAADHIFFEDWYRETGEWIVPEAAHGVPLDERKVR